MRIFNLRTKIYMTQSQDYTPWTSTYALPKEPLQIWLPLVVLYAKKQDMTIIAFLKTCHHRIRPLQVVTCVYLGIKIKAQMGIKPDVS